MRQDVNLQKKRERIQTYKPLFFTNILPSFVLIAIVLTLLVAPSCATDSSKEVVKGSPEESFSASPTSGIADTTTLSEPVGDQTGDELTGNSTPAVGTASELTVTPTGTSSVVIDNTTSAVQEPVLGNERAERSLPAEDPIRATSTVSNTSIPGTGPDIHQPGAAPVVLFVDTPVSETGPQAGYWNFDILNEVWAVDSVKINENSDDSDYLGVTVSNDIDNVIVEFVVGGETTTVNITKSYIDGLKKTGQDRGFGDTPMLHAWDYNPTLDANNPYDVDAGVRNDPSVFGNHFVAEFTPLDHLKFRGFSHDDLNLTHIVFLVDNNPPYESGNVPISRHFIMGPNDANIPGTEFWVNANATLNNSGSTLSYTVMASGSFVRVRKSYKVPLMVIIPQIWKHTGTGDVPVYTGSPSDCWMGTTCVATGAYTPSDSGTYYANTTVLYPERGFTKSTKSTNVTVGGTSNVVPFGDTTAVTHFPIYTDYTSLGGASAIRRDGSMDTFIGGRNLPGNDWVRVTNGAAITRSGELVTWTPSLSAPRGVSAKTILASESSKKYVAISQYSDWRLQVTRTRPVPPISKPGAIMQIIPRFSATFLRERDGSGSRQEKTTRLP